MADELTLIERMKASIIELKETVENQQAIIGSLCSAPLGYGTVLRVGNKNPIARPTQKNDFKKGVKVRVRAERLGEYNLKFPTGKVRDIEGDTAKVAMVQGGVSTIALSDLELQEPVMTYSDTVTVSINGSPLEVRHPKKIKDLKEGDTVVVNVMFQSIVDKAPTQFYGATAVVKEILENRYCEITEGDHTKTVMVGEVEKLEKGDVVVLDQTGTIIIKNNKQKTTEYTVESQMDVKWEQIGGLQEVKQQVHEMVELPHSNPEIFKFYNKKPSKGILLWGPPGCGKTLIAKAVATSLAKMYGGNLTESGFIYIKGPEILNPYVGVTEQVIRSIFERARKHKAKTGYPATIFIDEADSILSKRGSGISSDVDKTIVPMFLTEMDGLIDSAAFIILATNRADVLDPAVMREGRIDAKILIPRPKRIAAKEIVAINLKSTPVKGDINELAEFITTEIYETSLRETVSGAMIAGAVDQTISEAIRRELGTKGKPGGITLEDAGKALSKMRKREEDLILA